MTLIVNSSEAPVSRRVFDPPSLKVESTTLYHNTPTCTRILVRALSAINLYCSFFFQSLSIIIDKILRQAIKPNFDSKLVGKGLPAALLSLYPNVEWGAENVSVFISLIDRIYKIFKKLNDTRDRMVTTNFVWEGLTTIMKCLCQCIHKCPTLITENEPVLFKMKVQRNDY